MAKVSVCLAAMGVVLVGSARVLDASVADHIDASQVMDFMVGDIARFNGGLLRDSGGNFVYGADGRVLPDSSLRSSTAANAGQGMGGFFTDFDGFFRIAHLDRTFDNHENPWWDYRAGTPISQSRAVYINAVASTWLSGRPAEQAQYMNAATRGADFLYRPLSGGQYGFRDPVNGGYYWGVSPGGTIASPNYSSYSKTNGTKDAYGQVHPVLALATTYRASGNTSHLSAALDSWDAFTTRFRDTGYTGPYAGGAFLPSQNENFSAQVGGRNLDYMCHTFESAYMLYDALPAGHPRKAELRAQTEAIGNFIVHVMTQEQSGSGGQRAYIPWSYTESWAPVASDGVSTGHNFEYAFLLSRAVQHGVGDASWVDTAERLMNFGFAYGVAPKGDSGQYLFINQETLMFDGSPQTIGEEIGWWQQAELNRALAHFAANGRTDLWDEFDMAWAGYREKLMDNEFGGTFQWLDPATLDGPPLIAGTSWLDQAKGWEWKVYYHETMLYDELMRITQVPEPGVAMLAGVTAILLLARPRRVALRPQSAC